MTPARLALALAVFLSACRPIRTAGTPVEQPPEGPQIHGTIQMSGRTVQAAAGSGVRDLTDDFEVPDGFRVTLFAESPQLQNPSAIDVDERGRVWVAEAVNYRQWEGRNPGMHREGGDRIVILEDADGDGAAETSKTFVQDKDLVSPLGIAVVRDARDPRKRSVYVSCSPSIFVWTDEDGDDVPDKKEVFLTGFGGPNHDHGVHSIVVGPDGRFYLAVGNAGPHVVTDKSGWTLRSGSIYRGGGEHEADNHPGLVSDDGKVWVGGLILRCEPDGTGLTVMAHNFRNEYEVALDSFGNMFTADNDDDGNACCRTTWVMEGGNYGYFSADGARTWEADRRPGQDVWAAHWHQDDPGVMPAGTRNGAGGPTGVCVYEGDLFGPDWTGRVLNADAGANCVYAHVPVAKGAGIELQPGKLIASRPKSGEMKDRWFRPSDVCASTDGSILVADWWDPGVGGHLAGDGQAYGRILRIVPKGTNPRPPKIDVSTVAGAIEAARNPSVCARSLGASAIRLRDEDSLPDLDVLLADSSPRVRARATWLLARAGEPGHARLLAAMKEGDPDLAITAMRTLRSAERDGFRDGDALLHAGWRAKDPAASVRREAALVLADLSKGGRGSPGPGTDAGPLATDLVQAFQGDDRTYLEALGLAFELHAEEWFEPLCDPPGADPLALSLPRAQLAWRLHPRAAMPVLTARAHELSLPRSDRSLAIDSLAQRPDVAAAEATLNAALGGPEDTRELAAWWIRHNDETIWRDYKLAAQLPDDDRDGAKMIWTSGLVMHSSVDVDVDIAGASVVWLVVTTGRLGNGCDWADWIEPTFVGRKGLKPLVTMPWRHASAEWGSVQVGRNANGGPLAIDGQPYPVGIGTHAFSEIAYDVPKGYHRFRSKCGLDDGGTSQGGRPDVEFQVWTRVEPDPAEAAETARALGDPDTPASVLDPLVESLAGNRAGGLLLLRLAGDGKLSPRARAVAARFLPANPDLSVQALATEFFPPAAATLLPDPAEVLALDGAPANGARIFFSSAARCSTCHTYYGQGGDVGPDLTTIAAKYGKPEILDAILHPSKAIAHGFDAWLIETKDGLLETGFLLADGDPVVLKDTAGKRHVLPAAEIESRTKQTVSTMPDGVALGLTSQDLADLLRFLGTNPREPGKRLATRPLFDGKGLDGWTYFLEDKSAKKEDVWSVADGVLRCKGNPIGYLRTEESFTSFVLTLEWRFDPTQPPGNSGVLLRMSGDDQVWPYSIEAQLHHRDAGDIWNIGAFPMQVDPERTEGRRTRKTLPCNEKPIGEWNRYEITLDGGELTLAVNGQVQNTAHWCAETPGKICLQSEGAAIEFRNIEITPIER
jgi:putative membrane-bound dehydrogenase-like protein